MSTFSQIIMGRTKSTRNSVQVHFRVCPPNDEDGLGDNVEIDERRKSIIDVNSSKEYQFDGVYGPKSTQEEIFEKIAAPVVEDCLKGFNCTILCYGQIGTGKTYTMEGKLEEEAFDGEALGIIPRAIHRIFCILQKACPTNFKQAPASPHQASDTPHKGGSGDPFSGSANPFSTFKDDGTTMTMINGGNVVTHYSIKVSHVEIYNDELRDLLDESSASSSSSSSSQAVPLTPGTPVGTPKLFSSGSLTSFPQRLQIRGTPDQGFYVFGLDEKACESPEEAFHYFQQGSRRRTTGPTTMNANSSRAHSIFSIAITLHELSFAGGDEREVVGKLNLVDLAGGENVERSGVPAREIGRINRDLFSLSRCIIQVAERKRAEARSSQGGGEDGEFGSTLKSTGSLKDTQGTLKSSTLKTSSLRIATGGGGSFGGSLNSPKRASPNTPRGSSGSGSGTAKSSKLKSDAAGSPPTPPSTPPPPSFSSGDVASAGGGSSGFVNFRDCKLTEILQSSLGGNYFTTLIATMSGSSKYLGELEHTLSLAAKARQIENRPEANLRPSARNRLNALSEENDDLQKKMNALMRGIGGDEDLLRVPSSTWEEQQAELARAKAERDAEKKRWEETQGELNGIRERLKRRGAGGDNEAWTTDEYKAFVKRLKQMVEECIDGVEKAEGGIVKKLEDVKGGLEAQKEMSEKGGGSPSASSAAAAAAVVAAVRAGGPPHLSTLYTGLDIAVDGSLTSIVTQSSRFTKKLRDLVDEVEEFEGNEPNKEAETEAEEKKKKTEERIDTLLTQIREFETEKKRRDEDELDGPIDQVIRIMQGMKAYRQEMKERQLREEKKAEGQ